MSAPLTDEAAFWVGLVDYLCDDRGDAPDFRRRGDTARSRKFSKLSDVAVHVINKRLGAL